MCDHRMASSGKQGGATTAKGAAATASSEEAGDGALAKVLATGSEWAATGAGYAKSFFYYGGVPLVILVGAYRLKLKPKDALEVLKPLM